MTGRLYLDIGALIKLYIAENGSEWVQRHCQQGQALLLCPLQLVELRNAILAAAGRNIISKEAMQMTLRHLDQDLADDIFKSFQPNWLHVWQRADSLARQYTPKLLCRTLDILHVAIAESERADLLITGDKRQYALCKKTGIKVKQIPQ
ncbi:MAG: type II toxin-antitoxin system VapC family toxin [Coraliomargaritaceae bacterium]